MTAARAGRAQEGWGTGHGARNNSSGSHPAQELRGRFIIAQGGSPGQAGSAPAQPLFPQAVQQRNRSLAASSCWEYPRNQQTDPLPAFDVQPGGTQHQGLRSTGRSRGSVITQGCPGTALISQQHRGDGARFSTELPLGFRDLLRAWGGGRGEGSPPEQPGCDPGKFGVAPHRGRCG